MLILILDNEYEIQYLHSVQIQIPNLQQLLANRSQLVADMWLTEALKLGTSSLGCVIFAW